MDPLSKGESRRIEARYKDERGASCFCPSSSKVPVYSSFLRVRFLSEGHLQVLTVSATTLSRKPYSVQRCVPLVSSLLSWLLLLLLQLHHLNSSILLPWRLLQIQYSSQPPWLSPATAPLESATGPASLSQLVPDLFLTLILLLPSEPPKSCRYGHRASHLEGSMLMLSDRSLLAMLRFPTAIRSLSPALRDP